jgi:hypothetical protein
MEDDKQRESEYERLLLGARDMKNQKVSGYTRSWVERFSDLVEYPQHRRTHQDHGACGRDGREHAAIHGVHHQFVQDFLRSTAEIR